MMAMDVNVIRKANLRRLVKEAGSVNAFAEKLDTNPDYISSILSDRSKRNPGDQLMRRAEIAFGRAAGSLDWPDADTMDAAAAMQSLPDEARQAVFDFIGFQIQRSPELIAQQLTSKYFLKFVDGVTKHPAQPHKKKKDSQ